MKPSIRTLFNRNNNEIDLSTQKILYDQYHSLIYKIAYRYCTDVNAAKDIVQETFIRAFTYITSYESRENSSFEAWLVTIAKNESIKYIKKQFERRDQLFQGNIDEMPESGKLLENQVMTKITLNEVSDFVKDLPDRYKCVFLLRFFHEYPYKDIAVLLDISEDTARQRAHRAKNKVNNRLKERGL